MNPVCLSYSFIRTLQGDMTKAWACVTNQEAYEKYLLLTSSFLFPVRSRLGKLKKKAIVFMFPEHYNLGESNSCIISRLGVSP